MLMPTLYAACTSTDAHSDAAPKPSTPAAIIKPRKK